MVSKEIILLYFRSTVLQNIQNKFQAETYRGGSRNCIDNVNKGHPNFLFYFSESKLLTSWEIAVLALNRTWFLHVEMLHVVTYFSALDITYIDL